MKANGIKTTFSGTTIDPQAIEWYANSDPGFLACIIAVGGSTISREEANHADYFEFHLRRYIVGKTKTMHRVFAEVRQFLAFDLQGAQSFIPILIDRVEQTILLNEWYELMPRYEIARQRIEQKFGLAEQENLPEC